LSADFSSYSVAVEFRSHFIEEDLGKVVPCHGKLQRVLSFSCSRELQASHPGGYDRLGGKDGVVHSLVYAS
jgi:hypothetical protein